MTYFDETLTLDPITEQQSTPVLPEDRFIFELIGFERSQPDQWRKEGGIKWTFRVFDMDGRPFEFNDELYDFYRTTNVDKKTLKPLFTVGYSANEWASALLGRTLGVDANFSVSELRNKRMSAMVVWERQKQDKTKWSVKLASLRHVPVAPLAGGGNTPSSKSQVSADADTDEIDKKLAISKFERKLERARKKKIDSLPKFELAYGEIETATLSQIDDLIESIDEANDAVD